MPSSSKCDKYVTVHLSSNVEFSLIAVKASWFHTPETPLFMIVFWFMPIVGVCLGPISVWLFSLCGELLLYRRKS